MKRHIAFLLALLFYASILPWHIEAAQNISANILRANDAILKGPWVDVRAFMDGVSGRPTLAAWEADQVNGASPTVDALGAIQAAVDHALQNDIADVRLSDGWYKITGPIHLGYGGAFATVNLKGTHPMYAPGFSGVMIDARSFSNAPAIVVQGGRINEVSGLAIWGASQNYALGTYYPQLLAQNVSYDNISTASNWVSGITANGLTRYSPYAAIAIDPYSGVRPATSYPDVTYPTWTGIGTTQYGKNYSSNIRIKNCQIDGFWVAIVVQPSDADGNGDFTQIEDVTIQSCAYGISVGNSQSRNVGVKNVFQNVVHTGFVTDLNGKKLGVFRGPITNCSGGWMYQIFSFFGLVYAGPLTFQNFYVESLVRIGNLGSSGASTSPMTFLNCDLSYVGFTGGAATGYIYSVPMFAGSGGIILDGTRIYASTPFSALTGSGSISLDVRSSNIFSALTDIGTSDNNWMQAYNWLPFGVGVFSVHNPKLSGYAWAPTYTTQLPITRPRYDLAIISDTVYGRVPIHRYAKYYKNYNAATVPLQMPKYDTDRLTNPTLLTTPAFDNATSVYTFRHHNAYQTVNQWRIDPGDVLFHPTSSSMYVVDNVTAGGGHWDVSATKVSNYWVNSSGVKTSVVAVDPTEQAQIWRTGHKGTRVQYRGNVLSGSDNVTNVADPDGITSSVTTDFQVGDLLFSAEGFFDTHFPKGTTVAATGDGWIQLNKNATATDNGVAIELYR